VIDCKHVTAEFLDVGYPIVSIGEVQGRYVDVRNAPKTSRDFYMLLTQNPRRPAAGDLIMSRNASVGLVAQVVDPNPLFAMGQDVCLLRRRNRSYSPDFLQFLLSSPTMEKQLSRMMAGSTFKRLNVRQIKDLTIPFPSPPVQASIGRALGDTEDLIASLELLITKRMAIKQGMMQQLLTGKTRLPGSSGAWSFKYLGELANIRSGRSKVRTANGGGNRWIVDMGSVTRNGSLVVSKRTDSHDGQLRRGELVMPKDDIGGGNIIGRVGLIDRDDTYVLADHVFALTPFRDDSLFLNYAINSYDVNRSLRAQTKGSAQLGLSRRSVETQKVAIPELHEQVAIGAVLAQCDSELEGVRGRLAKARAIKQGMMQELLTGRIHLPVEEGAR
jgi:type I restriction enzyme S subunit